MSEDNEARIFYRPDDPRAGNEWIDLGGSAELSFTVKEPLSEMRSLVEDMRAIGEMIAQAPKPLSYLVLDHAMDPTEVEVGHDSKGRRYARCSPSLMDAMPHAKKEPSIADAGIVPVSLTGVPIYQREDLGPDWPLL